MLTGSRLSLNDSNNLTNSPKKKPVGQPAPQLSDKEIIETQKSSPSSGIGSEIHAEKLVQSSPMTTNSEVKSTPSMSIYAGSSPDADTPSPQISEQKYANRRSRYDAVYYTHEPIRGAPNGEFEEKPMDVDINYISHQNTAV